MTLYAEIDADGNILQTIGPEPDDAPAPSGPHQYVLIAAQPDWRACPSASHRLRLVGGVPAWVETAALEELKARKNEEINAARALANETTFIYEGKHIACDTLSKFDILSTNGCVALTGQFQPGWQGAWKAKDNTYVAIPDVATWTAFYLAMMNQGQGNFDHAQALKAQLAQAQTAEEVAAIHW